MSIHAQLSPEALAKLRAQRRQSTISSIVIAFLAIALVGLLLAIWLLPGFFEEETPVVAYSAPMMETQQQRPEKIRQQMTKPTPPSSQVAKVLASNAPSPVSIPVPDVEVSEPSLDFGSEMDFGESWGMEANAGSEASFFNQSVRAERIVWVIDYSKSMTSMGREALMRRELSKSVSEVSAGTQYQIIFFSGPAWIASDKVVPHGRPEAAEVITEDGKTYQWTSEHLWAWKQKGSLRQVPWIKATSESVRESARAVRSMALVGGTDWETPLEMAFNMDPAPQVVFFMTDGAMEQRNMSRLVRGLAAKAKAKGIVVNTITLIEPQAEEAMRELAERTGGQFTVIEKGGKIREE